MLELSFVLHKPAICPKQAKLLGKIKNAYFCDGGKAISHFIVEAQDGEFLLPFDKARCFSDAILLCDDLEPSEGEDVSALDVMLDKPVYSKSGTYMGNIADAVFQTGGAVVRYMTDLNAAVIPSRILAVGDVVILKSAGSAKPAAPRKMPRPKADYPVYILDPEQSQWNNGARVPSPGEDIMPDILASGGRSDEEYAPQAASDVPVSPVPKGDIRIESVPASQRAQAAPAVSLNPGEPAFSQGAFNVLLGGVQTEFEDGHTPTRIISDYEFLLGRTLSSDLSTYGGELIAPKGSEITVSVVEKARRAGKLVELTLSSSK